MNTENDIWLSAIDNSWPGEMRLRVTGQSMHPSVWRGDAVGLEPVAPAQLKAGDWIVVRTSSGPLLHRFLRFSRTGDLLTKGDALHHPDPLWDPELLLGRVRAIYRHGERIPVTAQSLRERLRTIWHRFMAEAWHLLKYGRLLVVLWLLFSFPTLLWAAVTLVSFDAQPQATGVKIVWETASEIDMTGFYIQRAAAEDGAYDRISESHLGGRAYCGLLL